MTILVYDFAHKRQTKAQDCWYACIQMLHTWRAGEKSKPRGPAVSKHRNIFALGRSLDFSSPQGRTIQAQNGLTEIGLDLRRNDADSVLKALVKYGPFILGGNYGPIRADHFVVICGVNIGTGMLYCDNPAWNKGKSWEDLSYLDKAWGPKEPADMIRSASAVALRPTA
jgi:hypothetical protein